VPGYVPFTYLDVIGLAIILSGLIIFRFYEPIRNRVYKLIGKPIPVEESPASLVIESAIESSEGATGKEEAGGEGGEKRLRRRSHIPLRSTQLEAFEAGYSYYDDQGQTDQGQVLGRPGANVRSTYLSRLGIAPLQRGGGSLAMDL